MYDSLKSRLRKDQTTNTQPDEPIQDDSSPLPKPNFLLDDQDGWTTFPDPLLYLYAGKGPYVGR